MVMGEPYESEKQNREVPVAVAEEDRTKGVRDKDETVYGLRRLITEIFFPDQNKDTSLLQRIKIAVAEKGPVVGEACRNAGRDVLRWTRRGSPLRALLVISVGTVALLAMTGFLIFLLFFLAATLNAIIISLLVSLAAVGGFLAIFFACVTAVYIGALSVLVFAISTATISAIIVVLIVTGWIGFFYVVWLTVQKSFGIAKHSLSASGSAISAFSYVRHARRVHKD